jgi:hypothetical protein
VARPNPEKGEEYARSNYELPGFPPNLEINSKDKQESMIRAFFKYFHITYMLRVIKSKNTQNQPSATPDMRAMSFDHGTINTA